MGKSWCMDVNEMTSVLVDIGMKETVSVISSSNVQLHNIVIQNLIILDDNITNVHTSLCLYVYNHRELHLCIYESLQFLYSHWDFKNPENYAVSLYEIRLSVPINLSLQIGERDN